jgi:outer membrane lipoprotein-sorting protein
MAFLMPNGYLHEPPQPNMGMGVAIPFRGTRALARGSLTVRRGLAQLLVVLCLLGIAGCSGGGQLKKASFDDLIRDVETKSYLVKQFRAEFEKTRRSAMFDRELTVKGNLVFQKPNKFQLTLTGAVNVEILSDGETIAIVHDGKDHETYHVQGERDFSRFADPLMVLLQGIGNGGLRKFSVATQGADDKTVMLEAKPNGELYFERTTRVLLKLSESGEIKSVRLMYADGDHDETVFKSWSMLARNDPAIAQLNNRLKKFSRKRATTQNETASTPAAPCPVRGASHTALSVARDNL